MASLNKENKIVQLIQNDVMLKFLIFTYKSFPPGAVQKNIFYLRPLQKVPSDPLQPWFTDTPMGKNTLGNMMKQMCQKAKVS